MTFTKGIYKVKEGRKVIGKVVDLNKKAQAFKKDTGKNWPYGISSK